MVGRGGNSSVTNNLGNISIDMSGTGLVSAGPQQAKEFGLQIQKLVQVQMVRESRPGGLLEGCRADGVRRHKRRMLAARHPVPDGAGAAHPYRAIR